MVAVEDGVTSARISQLQTNDRCYVELLLLATFHLGILPDLINKDLWMMGTGTGIAPYLSMLKNSDSILQRCCQISSSFTVSNEEQHLCSVEYISTLQTQYPALTYSRCNEGESSRSQLHKHIQTLLENQELCHKTGIDLSTERSVVLLCGHPQMIKESTDILKGLGFRNIDEELLVIC